MGIRAKGTKPQNIYTVFCRYQDGVYVRQLEATDLADAVKIWVQEVLPADIPVPKAEHSTIRRELLSEAPGAIQECKNAWAAIASHPSGPIWLDIVKTARV